MSELKLIKELVEASAKSLERGLREYWPVVNPDKNGLQESNLTTHLASEALRRGLFAFPQASNADSAFGHSRADLMLLDTNGAQKMVLLVEAKKLYSPEKAGEMVSDFEKMSRFKFVTDSPDTDIGDGVAKYGMLLAITTDPSNMQWWNQPYDWDCGASWDKLKSVIEMANLKSSIEFSVRNRSQYILYAVFKMPAI